MKKRLWALLMAFVFVIAMVPAVVLAYSDANNGDWSEKNVTLENTKEAELVVRVGDIDACNDEYAVSDNGYNPFTAKDQYAHGYAWLKDDKDPDGTDRIYVGSKWKSETNDGYSSCYLDFYNGNDIDNAYGEGALKLSMSYDASNIEVKSVILQLCIDDFQAVSHETEYSVTLNGKDAPFIAELLNHVDQTGPTSYVVSAIIPNGFFEEIASGKLEIVIDETTGKGDGYAIDFAKLLINYNEDVFTGTFKGYTEPGATVRLLGTSTTVTATEDGGFTFKAIPGLNAVRASKKGFVEGYDFGVVLSADTEWEANVGLTEGQGNPDIDFSQFGVTSGEGADGTTVETKPTETTASDSKVDENTSVKHKCKVCGICPFQPLGICLFIWLLIIVVVIVIVYIVIKKSKKDEEEDKNKKES